MKLALVALTLLALPAAAQTNILLLLADDIGVDRVVAYGEHPSPGRTPTIDELAANGVLFRNCWSAPICSPTRATILTGQLGFRNGIGEAVYYGPDTYELSPSLVTLPDLFQPTHATGLLGKWHLATSMGSGIVHPLLMGFDLHYGTNGNTGGSYYDWPKVLDDTIVQVTRYATTDTVDDAIAFIQDVPEPWFLCVAFNAAHKPFQAPPDDLHSYEGLKESSGGDPVGGGAGGSGGSGGPGGPGIPGAPQLPIDGGPVGPPQRGPPVALVMKAMVEALDTEIARLFESVPPSVLEDTFVVFVADNGTDKLATTAPFPKDHAKPFVYEGGINVPLIIVGPGIPQGAECAALVHTVDLYATIAEIAGIPQTTGTDSVSLVPYLTDPALPSIREHVYSERFYPNGFVPRQYHRRVVREERYKLLYGYAPYTDEPNVIELFDLLTDPFEQTNLLDGTLDAQAMAAYVSLVAAMDTYQLDPPAPPG